MNAESVSIRTSYEIHKEIRQIISECVGKVFTDDMMYKLRLEMAELIIAASWEAQAELAPHVCVNQGTPACPQSIGNPPVSEYSADECYTCIMNCGFAF